MLKADAFRVGCWVRGGPHAPRELVRHADLLEAFADDRIGDNAEGYLSHFVFDTALAKYHKANAGSVKGFTGLHCCRWLVLDIDADDLGEALEAARKLAALIHDRYGGNEPSVYFSGGKGFHLLLDLAAAEVQPSVMFSKVAKALAEALAARAGVKIDQSIYDLAHIIRLPNTRHAKTALFKRRVPFEALLRLTVDQIRDLARHPSGDGIGSTWGPSARLADDWHAAERTVSGQQAARAVVRRDLAGQPDARAPRYLLELLRFGCEQGERHATVFRCAAWLTEQGAPASLCAALLTEAALDIGLTPSDTDRQIRCGIEHARKQAAAAPMPTDSDAAERWCIEHEEDPLPPGATDFPFGANKTSEGGSRL